jgi:hypothetical protein
MNSQPIPSNFDKNKKNSKIRLSRKDGMIKNTFHATDSLKPQDEIRH